MLERVRVCVCVCVLLCLIRMHVIHGHTVDYHKNTIEPMHSTYSCVARVYSAMQFVINEAKNHISNVFERLFPNRYTFILFGIAAADKNETKKRKIDSIIHIANRSNSNGNGSGNSTSVQCTAPYESIKKTIYT